MKTTFAIVMTVGLALGSQVALAQSIDDNRGGAIEVGDDSTGPVEQPRTSGTPRVGRKAAEKYMSPRASNTTSEDSGSRSAAAEMGPSDHYLALNFGAFVSSTAYKWGNRDQQDETGQGTFGVTYRIGEWKNSTDFLMRIDYSTYSLDTGRASKLSFVPIVSFPDASSRFPLYFGGGIGLGIFTGQVTGESALAFEYQLILGARFFDIAETNAGFIVEAGFKNHILLSSDGQFNGTFVSVGPVFTF